MESGHVIEDINDIIIKTAAIDGISMILSPPRLIQYISLTTSSSNGFGIPIYTDTTADGYWVSNESLPQWL